MDIIIHSYEAVRDFLELGGGVLRVIGWVLLIMWALIIERLIYYSTMHKRVVKDTLAVWEDREDRRSWGAHQIRLAMISRVKGKTDAGLAMIQTLVALCPLLGLLGTVTGMIEVFDVMAMAGSGNVRSMAAGVSKATVPTMAGMVAALSGIAAITYLKRVSRHEVEHLRERLTTDH